MTGAARPEMSICGEIDEAPYERLEEALRPLLQRRFPGDPKLCFRIMDELAELRIYATGFDMIIQGHLFASSYDHGSVPQAIAFYREISAALAAHRIWHAIEIMVREPDGSWSDIITIP